MGPSTWLNLSVMFAPAPARWRSRATASRAPRRSAAVSRQILIEHSLSLCDLRSVGGNTAPMRRSQSTAGDRALVGALGQLRYQISVGRQCRVATRFVPRAWDDSIGMKIARPKSLTELVVEELRARIIDGRLRLGEALSENALAAELGISKTPVREALLQLKLEAARRGAAAARHLRLPPRARDQVVMISELREILEVAAVAAASSATTPSLSTRMSRDLRGHAGGATRPATMSATARSTANSTRPSSICAATPTSATPTARSASASRRCARACPTKRR